MKKIIYALFPFFIVSCAFHSGSIGGSGYPTSPNSRITSTAYGYANTSHVLGIGGLGSDALVLEAKKNLFNNYSLQKGESFVNFSVDFKRSYFFLFSITKVTVSAEVATYGSSEEKAEVTNDSPYLSEGDMVYYRTNLYEVEQAYLLKKSTSQKGTLSEITVLTFKDDRRPIIKTLGSPTLYKTQMTDTEKENVGYALGDTLQFNGQVLQTSHNLLWRYSASSDFKGIVKGYHHNSLVVEIISPPVYRHYMIPVSLISKD
ncbi:MAG: DUF6567 family protein [Owenweeksia sp.]